MASFKLTHRHLTGNVDTRGRNVGMCPGVGSNLVPFVVCTLDDRCKWGICDQVVVQTVDKECDLDIPEKEVIQ